METKVDEEDLSRNLENLHGEDFELFELDSMEIFCLQHGGDSTSPTPQL